MRILPNSKIEEINSSYMLGVLATDEKYFPPIGETQEVITTAKRGSSIIFFVKALSPDPNQIHQIGSSLINDFYIGFDNDSLQVNLGPEYKHLGIQQKIDYLRSKLEGKLLLFNPTLKDDERSERYHKNLSVFSIEGQWNKESMYQPVPIVKMQENYFQERLIEGRSIDLEQYNHSMPAPSCIRCGDYIYTNLNHWEKHPTKQSTWRLASVNGVKRIKLSDVQYKNHLGAIVEYLEFVDEHYLDNLKEDSLQYGEDSSIWKRVVESKNEQKRNSWDGEDRIEGGSEIGFIHYLERLAIDQKLYYKKEDLINFHTSVKTNPLTILSGQSGVGKTRLAQLYGRALGLSQEGENQTMMILPVSPSFTEPGDVLGFLNASTGLYTPSETGFVDFLIRAEKNPEQLFLIILDEMNISKIEYWFSPFISLLELDPEDRILQLYSEKMVCHNRFDYPSSIKIGQNLLMVGCINMDETTCDLSDRLMDRSNLVVPNKLSFIEVKRKLNEQQIPVSIDTRNNYKTTTTYQSWKTSEEPWNAFTDEELEFFESVHQAIHSLEPMKGFSFRNIVRMGDYLNNIPKDMNGNLLIGREEAIDLFIKQRLLTKIRGSIEVYEDLIGTLSVNQTEITNGKLYQLFTSEVASSIGPFENTKEELRRKARELLVNGYAT